MSKYVVIFSDVPFLDGLVDSPIQQVDLVGVAEDDIQAIDLIAAHRTSIDPAFTDEIRQQDVSAKSHALEFLRGAGPRGEEIHAGINGTVYYRAMPLAS